MSPVAREVVDVHMRYVKAVGAATLQYLGGLFSVVMRRRRRRDAVVLEAPAGAWAVGAFAVANHLTRPVSAALALSPFRDRRGAVAPLDVRVEPAMVELEAAQQAVVRIGVAVDERLDARAEYSGFVSIPGLADRPIPVIVRRSVA